METSQTIRIHISQLDPVMQVHYINNSLRYFSRFNMHSMLWKLIVFGEREGMTAAFDMRENGQLIIREKDIPGYSNTICALNTKDFTKSHLEAVLIALNEAVFGISPEQAQEIIESTNK